jgi:hypothetical protein
MLILFKAFLILAVICGSWLLIRQEHLFLQRLMGITLGVLLCWVVLFPECTTRLAHFFGIGRGVDFLFYLAHLCCLYALLMFYRRIKELQRQVTLLVREKALQEAHKPGS